MAVCWNIVESSIGFSSFPTGVNTRERASGTWCTRPGRYLTVKSNSDNRSLQRIRWPVESEIVIGQRRASWSVLTVNVSPSMYGRNVVTLHMTE